MVSKDELQNRLKAEFGINKNISDSLSKNECEELLQLLQREPSALKLVRSYAEKNSSLGRNNAALGGARSRAERKFADLQADYSQLKKSIQAIEEPPPVERKKIALDQEQKRLEAEIQNLSARVQTLTAENKELVNANTQLKKENKDLKNIVDEIRLKLAKSTKQLLQLEDSEIRKALIRLFRATLG